MKSMTTPSIRSSRSFWVTLFPLLAALTSAFLVSCENWDDDDYDDDDDCHRHTDGVGTVYIHCHDDDDDFADDNNDDDFDDDDDHRFLLAGRSARVTTVTTDHPVDGVRELFVTIRIVSLVGADASIEPVFQCDVGRRIDLLSLRGDESSRLFDILSVRSLVPTGAYVSAIVRIENPVITLDDGTIVPASDVELAANGVIQTDFAKPLSVGPGELAYLVVDFDVERSLSRETGRWKFRPLVLLDFAREPGTGEDDGRMFPPADLIGLVDGIDEASRSFQLVLPADRGSIPVDVVESALVLEDDFDLGNFESIENGDVVSLRGFLHTTGELDAHSIVIGETSSEFGRLDEIERVEGGWGLSLEDAGGELIEYFVPPNALLTERRRGPVDASVLAEGCLVRVSAVARENDSAAAVRLDVERPPEAATTNRAPKGAIDSVDLESRAVRVAGGTTIRLAEDVHVLAVEDQGDVLVERTLTLDELGAGWRVESTRSTTSENGAIDLLVVTPEES